MVGMCRRLAAVFDVMDMDDKRISQLLGYSGQATLSSVRKGTTFLDTERLATFGRLRVRDCAKPNLHWILTGDGAAAPRYIEARLSKFALEVLFNVKTTEWKLSYFVRVLELPQSGR